MSAALMHSVRNDDMSAHRRQRALEWSMTCRARGQVLEEIAQDADESSSKQSENVKLTPPWMRDIRPKNRTLVYMHVIVYNIQMEYPPVPWYLNIPYYTLLYGVGMLTMRVENDMLQVTVRNTHAHTHTHTHIETQSSLLHNRTTMP